MLTVLAQAGLAQDGEETIRGIFGVLFGVVGGIVGLLYVLLFLCALVSILRNQRLTGGGKFLWIVVALAYPFLGSLGWFVFGKSAQLVKSNVPV